MENNLIIVPLAVMVVVIVVLLATGAIMLAQEALKARLPYEPLHWRGVLLGVSVTIVLLLAVDWLIFGLEFSRVARQEFLDAFQFISDSPKDLN